MNKFLNPCWTTAYITVTILKDIHKIELSVYIVLQHEACYLPLPYSSSRNSASYWFLNSFYISSIANCKLNTYAYWYHRNKSTWKSKLFFIAYCFLFLAYCLKIIIYALGVGRHKQTSLYMYRHICSLSIIVNGITGLQALRKEGISARKSV